MSTQEDLPQQLYRRLRQHFSSTGSGEDGPFVYNAKATVMSVEDGDTWKGIRKPDPFITFEPEYYRLDDIDTHETDGKKQEQAKKEKQFTQDFVKQGQENWSKDDYPFLVAFTDPTDDQADYSGPEYEGTYGRPIADLIRRSDGQSLKQALLNEFGDAIRATTSGQA